MYVCVPHVRKSTTDKDRNLLGEESIILSLKLASMSHSCPCMPGQCDMTTPLYRVRENTLRFTAYVLSVGTGAEFHFKVEEAWKQNR